MSQRQGEVVNGAGGDEAFKGERVRRREKLLPVVSWR